MSDTTKFVITKGIANEYYITIKQDDSTLPMEIVTGTNAILEDINTIEPTFYTQEAVEYKAAVPAVEAVEAVVGQSFIPAVVGQVEINRVTAYVLDSGTTDEGITYTIQINNTSFSKLYRKATYAEVYLYFQAFAAEINASAEVNTIVEASVDTSALIITGKQVGISYTINASAALYIAEVQKAVASVAGQPFIAAVTGVNAVAAIPEVVAVPEKYKRKAQTHTITLVDQYANRYARDTTVTVEGTGVVIKVDGIQVTPVNGVYDINTALEFDVELSADVAYSEIRPAEVVVSTVTTYTVTADTFAMYIYDLETGAKVATLTQAGTIDGQISVYDKNNGKLKIVLSEELTNRLTAVRGNRADYYYSKPVYRIVVDASTVNNGEFIATIDKVYVA